MREQEDKKWIFSLKIFLNFLLRNMRRFHGSEISTAIVDTTKIIGSKKEGKDVVHFVHTPCDAMKVIKWAPNFTEIQTKNSKKDALSTVSNYESDVL